MKTKFCFYSQLNYSHPRTAIEAEILFAARVKHLRFLKRPSGKTPLKKKQQRQKDWSGKRGAAFCFLYSNSKQNAAVRQRRMLIKKKHCVGGFSAYGNPCRKRKNEAF